MTGHVQRVLSALVLCMCCLVSGGSAQELSTIDARVRALLARMTVAEKFWQLYMTPDDLDNPAHDYRSGSFGLQVPVGNDTASVRAARAHAQRINDIQRFFVERTRLGIPIIPFDEAVHGLARAGATMFPQAIALAATWDPALVARVADAIARETRSRGIRQVLSPVVNLASDVRWGRVEETYGEDPYLSSRMAEAFVRSFEQAGIVTTPKHFVANVGDGGRDSYPIDYNHRLLAELHFPPFRAALRAGARSVMTAYNSVDGTPATQNRWLLTDQLKRAWQFGGFVISDAAATGGATVLHLTEPNTPTAARHAFTAGLDVVFQSSYEQHRPYLDAFQRGLIPDSVIDAAVARVLRAKLELGLFEKPYTDPDSAAYWNGHITHRELARSAASASIVLLKNTNRVLPLSPSTRSIAVIGTDAVEARLGGYSGPGFAKVSILDGIRTAVGSAATVRFAPGPGRAALEHVVVPAAQLDLRAEYFDNIALDGEPRVVRKDSNIDFRWTFNAPARGLPTDWYSVRWTGTLTAPAGGVRRLGIEGTDGYRLWLDDKLIIDNWRKQSYHTMLAPVTLEPGQSHDLRIEYFETTGNARVRLVWDAGADRGLQARIDSAVAIASASDVAIVVAGIEEGEFRDRAFLGLPGRQEDLIRAVSATGKPVIVVTIGGSALLMGGWIDRVDAILHAWYPGEQGGLALADVLFGAANPAGRLPITFPLAEGQLPLSYNHKPTGRGDDYVDLTGLPLFPFGFGLSYTTFAYSNLTIEPAEIGVNGSVEVRCTVTNTGTRTGDEVAQLYLRDMLATVARPVVELKGFQRIRLAPGEARTIVFRLGPEDLRMLDADLQWRVEPGAFRIMIGSSSKDIRLRSEFRVR